MMVVLVSREQYRALGNYQAAALVPHYTIGVSCWLVHLRERIVERGLLRRGNCAATPGVGAVQDGGRQKAVGRVRVARRRRPVR